MTNVFEKGLFALTETDVWERIEYVDNDHIGLTDSGRVTKESIKEVSVPNDIRFTNKDGGLAPLQIELIKSGDIKLLIPAGTRYYREDTLLMFGEENENERGEFIRAIDEDGEIEINDGDGDTSSFGKTRQFTIVVVKDLDLITERIEDIDSLKTLEPNQLVDVVKASILVRDELEEKIKDLQDKLSHEKILISEAQRLGKAFFKIED